MSFCMAAAYEFKCSSSFPGPFALRSCFRSNRNHNKVILDFLMKWPIAFRRLLQQNCSINLSGKKAKGIELDCWVESQIVKPTKKFLSGHSTLKICTTLGGSVDLVSTIKNAYKGPKAFNDHSTTRHSVSSPLPDQLKGTWFCVRKGMFGMNSTDEEVSDRENSVEGFEMEEVPKMCINVDEKGWQKLNDGFKKKLFDLFPDIRFVILENKEET